MSRPLFEGSRRQQPRRQVSLLSCAGNHDPHADQKDRSLWERDCLIDLQFSTLLTNGDRQRVTSA